MRTSHAAGKERVIDDEMPVALPRLSGRARGSVAGLNLPAAVPKPARR